VRVLGLAWLGVFPERFHEMVGFLGDGVGLERFHADDDVTMLRTERGDIVEVFRPAARYDFATTGPVPGLCVDDVDGAVERLREAGVRLLGGTERWEEHAWQHFRAPDGNVWEVTSGPYRPDGPGRGLPWVGVRTARSAEMAAFARDVLGMRVVRADGAITELAMENDDRLEVIDRSDGDHLFFEDAPVVALEVPDVPATIPDLVQLGGEMVIETRRSDDGRAVWQHLRGPDGHLYEIISRAQ
jgi:catechol 2,3-dioxygenase-like lactoylglutathione lyase family enzyme